MNGYNFTERTRKVLAMAREEAHRLGHEYVGTEHILLGLIREGEGVAAAALQGFSIELPTLRAKIESVVKPSPERKGGSPDLPYTSRAKKSLELAMSEARELNHSYVGTEHLLLGLIREEKGIAAQVLFDMGLTLPGTRDEIVRLLGTDAETPTRDTKRGARREWVTDADGADMAAFGPELGPLYHAIRNEAGWLYVKWDQFRALFGGSVDGLDLLNGTAPLFFRVVQEALWNDMGGHLRALSADRAAGSVPKMSVREIPDLLPDAKLRAEVELLVARAVRATEFVHHAPTRQKVGTDLAIALERRARQLDAPSRAVMQDAIESIVAILNHLSWHYRKATTTFDTAAGYPHGAVALLHALQQGRSARDTRRDVGAREDQPPDVEGPHPH